MQDTDEKEREAAPNKKAVAEMSIMKNGLSDGPVQIEGTIRTFDTKTDTPHVGNEDLLGGDARADSKRGSTNGKGDPIAANNTYRLRGGRSTGGALNGGNALDVSLETSLSVNSVLKSMPYDTSSYEHMHLSQMRNVAGVS